MAEVIAAIAPARRRAAKTQKNCRIQIHAEVVSIGGGILLGLFCIITALFAMVIFSPTTTSAQWFIAIVLFLASIAYVVNSLTERMTFVGNVLTYNSLLSAKRSIPLDELDAVILTHEGFNLEKGMQSIELRRMGRKPDRIPLGPCWQEHKLEEFIQSVSKAMHAVSTPQFYV